MFTGVGLSEYLMKFSQALPPAVRLLVGIVLAVILLGAGIYDTKTQAEANRRAVSELEAEVEETTARLQQIDQDVGNVLCILRAEARGGEIPLSCLVERRGYRARPNAANNSRNDSR